VSNRARDALCGARTSENDRGLGAHPLPLVVLRLGRPVEERDDVLRHWRMCQRGAGMRMQANYALCVVVAGVPSSYSTRPS
jgi:hypothetical protein